MYRAPPKLFTICFALIAYILSYNSCLPIWVSLPPGKLHAHAALHYSILVRTNCCARPLKEGEYIWFARLEQVRSTILTQGSVAGRGVEAPRQLCSPGTVFSLSLNQVTRRTQIPYILHEVLRHHVVYIKGLLHQGHNEMTCCRPTKMELQRSLTELHTTCYDTPMGCLAIYLGLAIMAGHRNTTAQEPRHINRTQVRGTTPLCTVMSIRRGLSQAVWVQGSPLYEYVLRNPRPTPMHGSCPMQDATAHVSHQAVHASPLPPLIASRSPLDQMRPGGSI